MAETEEEEDTNTIHHDLEPMTIFSRIKILGNQKKDITSKNVVTILYNYLLLRNLRLLTLVNDSFIDILVLLSNRMITAHRVLSFCETFLHA